jgi:hypothetical protein
VARPVDPADVWDDATAEKAAVAMAAWLKGSLHLSRPISSLTKTEMKNLALVANHTWIVEMSRRADGAAVEIDIKPLSALLA